MASDGTIHNFGLVSLSLAGFRCAGHCAVITWTHWCTRCRTRGVFRVKMHQLQSNPIFRETERPWKYTTDRSFDGTLPRALTRIECGWRLKAGIRSIRRTDTWQSRSDRLRAIQVLVLVPRLWPARLTP
ncbi:hypothetical protein LIA77_03733 [Sarocladium implicatum]|nr:hypothetical protein LIA77_03733 [Sarocladium implicatum]